MSIELSANNEELNEKFLALLTPQDVADLLEVNYKRLIYHIYGVLPSERYKIFRIPKKSGDYRLISAPATALKIIQQKLNQVLQAVYNPKPSVHSFIYDKSIVTNSQLHINRKYIFNIDLKDFFPSINFGRVRGMFISWPYNLPRAVATILAQICCFNNQLPQGAPTSPIVSNMICAKMDSELQRLAKKKRCIYSRYADDITFSTNLSQFPPALAKVNSMGQLQLGSELSQVIRNNGFEINSNKVRLQKKRMHRQEVTGITVNQFPNVKRKYIRQISAMLNAWKKYGLEAAQVEFSEKYNRKYRNPDKKTPLFEKVVKGKIEFLSMVRGKDDPIYLRFLSILRELAPDLVKDVPLRTEKSGNDYQEMESNLIKVLIVFSNPRSKPNLRLQEEERVIKECIRLGKRRDLIRLETCPAATIHDLRRALLDNQYRIIHFSGHATKRNLIFEDTQGNDYSVEPKALADIISVYSPPIVCIFSTYRMFNIKCLLYQRTREINLTTCALHYSNKYSYIG